MCSFFTFVQYSKDVHIIFQSQFIDFISKLSLYLTISRLLMPLGKKPFENIVGKGKNAGNQHFLLFPQCFLPFQKLKINF